MGSSDDKAMRCGLRLQQWARRILVAANAPSSSLYRRLSTNVGRHLGRQTLLYCSTWVAEDLCSERSVGDGEIRIKVRIVCSVDMQGPTLHRTDLRW